MLPPVRRAAAAAAAVVLLAGCGGSDTIGADRLDELVLHQADLGRAFSSFYVGRLVRLDTLGTSRADPERFGRKGGWIARFRRAGSAKTQGPLVVESRADLFSSDAGARSDLAAYRTEFDRIPGSQIRRLSVSGLGDEAIGITWVQPGGLRVRFFTIAWRDRNVSASVTAEGFDGKITRRDVERLANRQDKRIADA
jgi:hypothetical protein